MEHRILCHETPNKNEIRGKLYSGEWKDDDVIIFNPFESEFMIHFDYSQIIAKTFRELNSGACNTRYPILNPGHEVIQWPLFWLTQTYQFHKNFVRQPDHFPTKLFGSLNGQVRPNRTILWNELKQNQLLNKYCSYIGKGIIFDIAPKVYPRDEHFYIEYTTDQTVLSHSLPTFYKDILIDVVCETHVDMLFFTEKTWKPFLGERIPLLITAPGAYKKLKTWGFEEYTEVFDYSFDKISDLEDRIKNVVNQLKTLAEFKDPKQLYVLTKEKREHNRENCLKLIKEGITPELAFEDKVCLNALKHAKHLIKHGTPGAHSRSWK